jgi:hypothetical protein
MKTDNEIVYFLLFKISLEFYTGIEENLLYSLSHKSQLQFDHYKITIKVA